MLKSKGNELPDWTNPEDYAFLDHAKPEVWAWEFLRRNHDYREDWKKYGGKQDVYHYEPPKHDDETKRQWMSRAVHELDVDPIMTRKDLLIAHKWGVQSLYDPLLPHHPRMCFIKPWGDFPRFIFLPDDFYSLVDDDERGFQRVTDDYAIIAFRIARPHGDQIKAAEKMLKLWKAELKKTGRIKPEGHGNKKDKWLRHIRVLDARRSEPPVTYAKIALAFGGKKSANKTQEELNDEGEGFVVSARQMMRGGYRKILLFKDTPTKDTP